MLEYINIVDNNGNRIGEIEKMEAHIQGILHEAFSIFIFNDKQEILLQQRASSKYHSGGLWTNTCCSHPRVGENIETAVHRRLMEEMGFDCELNKLFSFVYKTEKLKDDLVEHEFDYVFAGFTDQKLFTPNTKEVESYKWITIDEVKNDITKNPQNYTSWFKIILENSEKELKKIFQQNNE